VGPAAVHAVRLRQNEGPIRRAKDGAVAGDEMFRDLLDYQAWNPRLGVVPDFDGAGVVAGGGDLLALRRGNRLIVRERLGQQRLPGSYPKIRLGAGDANGPQQPARGDLADNL